MDKNIYDTYTDEMKTSMQTFCDGYKKFISDYKTERECIVGAIDLAEKAGFKDLSYYINNSKKLEEGDKVYVNDMNKGLLLFVKGKASFSDGMNIIGSHVDSPRIDLKANAIYEDGGFCLFDTHYYGGIKKYQWVTLPLALHGVVIKKDGTKVIVNLGEKEDEPVVATTDLLPHLERRDNTANKTISGEELNLIIGNQAIKDDKNTNVKNHIIKILKDMNIEEGDLFSAEIEAVPAGKAREFGLDKSMIIGYGQDDRVCAYASIMALLECKDAERNICCMLVDKEEIGSMGATGARSRFYENAIAEIMELASEYSELNLRRVMSRSYMLSSDVTAGFDPNYPSQSNKNTEAFLGRGVNFSKYGGGGGKSGSNDANPEFIAKLRNLMDENNINYQATEMGKVDAGGGGTIAQFMANLGMEVIDCGVPVLNMHAPHEITSKIDIYENYRCDLAFYKSSF